MIRTMMILRFVALLLVVSSWHVEATTLEANHGGHDSVRAGSVLPYNEEIIGKYKAAELLSRQTREVQDANKKGKPIVFVLDASNSMNTLQWAETLLSSLGYFIRHMIKDGESLAFVQFSTLSKVLQPLREVKDRATREQMVDAVNQFRLGPGTSTGGGLRAGLEVLESNGTQASGGTIILVSDGEENREPYSAEELPKVIAKGVTVHTLALGSKADKKLEDIALRTGGRFLAIENDATDAIYSMLTFFLQSTTSQLEESQKPIILLKTSETLNEETQTKKVQFTTRRALGKQIRVLVSARKEGSFKAYVLDPNGWKCTVQCNSTQEDRIVQVDIPQTRQTETWTVVVEKTVPEPVVVSVVVVTRQ